MQFDPTEFWTIVIQFEKSGQCKLGRKTASNRNLHEIKFVQNLQLVTLFTVPINFLIEVACTLEMTTTLVAYGKHNLSWTSQYLHGILNIKQTE